MVWMTGFLCGAQTATVGAADGLTRVQGKHIELVTDLPKSPVIQTYVDTFDAAVPQWEKFLDLPSGSLQTWSVEAFLMEDVSTFRSLDLIDPRVPETKTGYALANQLWIVTQPSEYYTRHLLLHEGVHALVLDQFGDIGPTWFAEGMAELLATHQGKNQNVKTIAVPASREESVYWGRFKKMDQNRDEQKIPTVETVMRYRPNQYGDVRVYGWSWVLTSLAANYPRYRQTLLQAFPHGRDTDTQFNSWFYRRMSDQWPVFQARWRNLATDFHYGFDWQREQIQISTKDPMWDGSTIKIPVVAQLGWQSAGVRIPAGAQVKITADGSAILDTQPRNWLTYPDGITYQYNNQKPLGQLIGRLLPNLSPEKEHLEPMKTFTIGSGVAITVEQPSWLLLRVNDRLADQADNKGGYQVQISRSNRSRP